MKKSIALILTVVALAAMTITAGASEATALDMQQYTVQSYTEAEYNTTPDGMTSVLFRPLTRNISPVPDTALEEVSEFGHNAPALIVLPMSLLVVPNPLI